MFQIWIKYGFPPNVAFGVPNLDLHVSNLDVSPHNWSRKSKFGTLTDGVIPSGSCMQYKCFDRTIKYI